MKLNSKTLNQTNEKGFLIQNKLLYAEINEIENEILRFFEDGAGRQENL